MDIALNDIHSMVTRICNATRVIYKCTWNHKDKLQCVRACIMHALPEDETHSGFGSLGARLFYYELSICHLARQSGASSYQLHPREKRHSRAYPIHHVFGSSGLYFEIQQILYTIMYTSIKGINNFYVTCTREQLNAFMDNMYALIKKKKKKCIQQRAFERKTCWALSNLICR